jgi:glyoxylate carboligase
MATAYPRRSGAQVLIDQLRIHGTDTIFGVPGESYLAALDALYAQRNSIRYVICRQEGGASYMAEAYGKLTGKPGVCFVTRGPGATNASVGMHTGFQDSTPMILLVGQVAREQSEREAFQEIDYRRMYGQMAKWVTQIEDARRIPEIVSQAFHRAMNGRPGPVVIALPEDMLVDEVEVADTGPYKVARGAPAPEDMATFRELLAAAKRLLPAVRTKSGLMLGLGETREELLDVFADLLDHGVDYLTLGQYLQPTLESLPVERYVPPEEFAELGRLAQGMGFRKVASGPLVRSSYHARDMAEDTGP